MKFDRIMACAAATLAASAAFALTAPERATTAPMTAPAGAAAAGVGAAPADVAHGRQLFVAIGCYQCHGYVGQGSQSTGPALVAMRLGDEEFVHYLRAPRGVMPAFSAKLLPAPDARDVLAYVRSLSPGTPAEKIALLAPYVVRGTRAAPAARALPAAGPAAAPASSGAAGGKLFAANCAVCHGANLEGGVGPALRAEGSKYSADRIAAIILNPPAGMPKLSPVPLNAGQVGQVAAFVHEKH